MVVPLRVYDVRGRQKGWRGIFWFEEKQSRQEDAVPGPFAKPQEVSSTPSRMQWK
jgi:hypothetical protein